MEFSHILDVAAKEQDPIRRMALAGLFFAINVTTIEKFPAKPFNPMLGETYEYVIPGKCTYLAEQVSHHPPISAFEFKGEAGYKRYGTVKLQTSLSTGSLSFYNPYKEYFEFPLFEEKFEFMPGNKSIHNLIMGSPYLEVTGKSYLKNQACPNEEYVEIEYFRRGWTADTCHRLQGKVYSRAGEVAYRIEGRFCKEVCLINAKTGVKEMVWTKQPYP